MATVTVNHKRKSSGPSKKTRAPISIPRDKHIAAGEFKAKCLAILDEVSRTHHEVVITKRGKALAKLVPFEEDSVDSLFGRLKGIVEIVGDPNDLIKPVFPLEDYDMLK